ncbi:hypothetical protein E4T56_gene1751, partial [Termitomyces sp. T112]
EAPLRVQEAQQMVSEEDKLTVARARKIHRLLTKPFHVAEVFTGISGKFVQVEDTVRSFKAVVDGEYDHLPEAAFYMVGGIDEAVEKAKKLAAEALVRSEEVHMVVVPGSEGEFGVLEGHGPFLSTIADGTVKVYKSENAAPEEISIAGGFAEVTPKGLTVLAEKL